MDERIEKQEIYCHNCNSYVQFPMDLSLNGNHVLKCPNCQHEHCRVVKDGVITGDRWDQRNGDTWRIRSSATTASATSASSSIWTFSSAGTSSAGNIYYASGV
jgi:hypothetical protein